MASKIQTLSFGPSTTLQQDIAQFAAFDTSLGTLTGKVITVEYDYTVPQQGSLILYPVSVLLAPGAQQPFTPALRDAAGNLVTAPYSFSVIGSGAIDTKGVYTAAVGSNATIQVSAGGLTAQALVTVDTGFTPGIIFDQATGIFTIRANGFTNTASVKITIFNGFPQAFVSLSSSDSAGILLLNQSMRVQLNQAKHIYFYAQAGVHSSFYNGTAVPCTAHGGSGTNTIIGGGGGDQLYAGTYGLNNTLKGMDGDNLIVGGPGTNNNLYGGPGNNLLIPGTGTNYLYPNG